MPRLYFDGKTRFLCLIQYFVDSLIFLYVILCIQVVDEREQQVYKTSLGAWHKRQEDKKHSLLIKNESTRFVQVTLLFFVCFLFLLHG